MSSLAPAVGRGSERGGTRTGGGVRTLGRAREATVLARIGPACWKAGSARRKAFGPRLMFGGKNLLYADGRLAGLRGWLGTGWLALSLGP